MRSYVMIQEVLRDNVGEDQCRYRVSYTVLIDIIDAGSRNLQQRVNEVLLETVERGLEHKMRGKLLVSRQNDKAAKMQTWNFMKLELGLTT